MKSELLNESLINKLRVEYVTSDTDVKISDLALNSGVPETVLKDISVKSEWESQRKAFRQQQLTEILERTAHLQANANKQTIEKGTILQEKIFNCLLDDIEQGNFHPTISDFNRISQTISEIGKESTNNIGILGNNNKIVNIKIEKPLEECSIEELVEIQSEINRSEET